ncbi:hypothetical protein [Cyanobium sp. Morenito 9A2]|uniref:hypothetical protein n=1 Tax=Cyanobium sp. Morenito 9A2 TaxID=2823718 RepID=UPI0020CF1379|nr:hypothetical protein [Cyanobium sp. Morenito 9A2]MCP9851021.1 hypothetical protein [Cyanobium sp. Morenito 9A2]
MTGSIKHDNDEDYSKGSREFYALSNNEEKTREIAESVLFTFLGSKEYKNRVHCFYFQNNYEVLTFLNSSGGYGNYTRATWEVITDFLKAKDYITFTRCRKTGRKRTKSYSDQEIRRAETYFDRSFLYGYEDRGTVKRYRSVLGEERPRHTYVQVNVEKLYHLLEAKYGLPEGITATEFARLNNLPTSVVKQWARQLMEDKRLVLKMVRGRRILRRSETSAD